MKKLVSQSPLCKSSGCGLKNMNPTQFRFSSDNFLTSKWPLLPEASFIHLVVLCALMTMTSAFGQAPQLASVAPVDGAIGIATDSIIVFTFDQPLNEATSVFQGVPPVAGNFEIQPSGLFFNGELSADRTKLSLTPEGNSMPPNTEITWILNPAGAFFPIVGDTGLSIATTSGSFTTGGNTIPAPELSRVFPEYDATDVSPNTFIIFDFDQNMDISAPPQISLSQAPFGNIRIEPDSAASSFAAEWDGSSGLALFNTIPLQPGTTITWTLNPAGTSNPLTSADGGILVEIGGSFSIAGESTGSNEECDPMDDDLGSYFVSKTFGHVQISASEVIPKTDEEAFFGTAVESPPNGPAVTDGSITIPGGTTQPLKNSFSFYSFFSLIPEEAIMESVLPAGNYVLRFNQEGRSERVISMTMPSTFASIPTIQNYGAAQAIDSTQDFALEWGEFLAVGSGRRITVTITDLLDKIIFMAPNDCIPRDLSPSATSIVIPAGYLRPGTAYAAILQFSDVFYNSLDDVLEMSGSGAVSRTTSFEIQTLGEGSIDLIPATFTNYRLLPNGNPELTIFGSESAIYSVERSASLGNPSWITVGSITTSAAGNGVFEDTDNSLVPRAVSFRTV